jgi:2-polyprenyl-6-hydroxyphenyl methylase/3-demethylubiquinone-9 3-methyltransferase
MTQSAERRAPVTRPADAFAFGTNWLRYIDAYLDPERVAIAKRSLTDLVGEDLAGKTFVDIGAGSGLFSLCAQQAGAARVISVDVDPDSVAASRELRRRAGDPPTWDVLEGSVLDADFLGTLAPGDIVYSWGVLHHTGDMYTAIRQAAGVVKPGGLFVIAIYNRATGRFLDSARWSTIKRRYNHSSRPTQRAMEAAFFCYWTATQLKARKNPTRVAREYKSRRGMAMMTDLVDWIGGYPYEYATADEITDFCRAECAMDVVKVLATPATGTGNNQFVFRRRQEDQ